MNCGESEKDGAHLVVYKDGGVVGGVGQPAKKEERHIFVPTLVGGEEKKENCRGNEEKDGDGGPTHSQCFYAFFRWIPCLSADLDKFSRKLLTSVSVTDH